VHTPQKYQCAYFHQTSNDNEELCEKNQDSRASVSLSREMAHLLNLPREVRDLILTFAISHEETAPRTPQDLDLSQRIEMHDLEYYSPSGGTGVKYSLPIPETSPFALLASSRQLRAETISAIFRFPKPCTRECEILILNEQEIYVTWTYVSPLFGYHPFLCLSHPGLPDGVNLKIHFKPKTRLTIRSFGIFHPTRENPV
jgi:hypothetical protein